MRAFFKWLLGLSLLPILFYLMIAYQLALGDFMINHPLITEFDWLIIYNMVLLAVLVYLGLFFYLKRGEQWQKLSKKTLLLVLVAGLPMLFLNNALGFFILRLEGRFFQSTSWLSEIFLIACPSVLSF